MRNTVLFPLFAIALLAGTPLPARGQGVTVEQYGSVTEFKARLAGFPIKIVTFDDIGTTASGVTLFAATRYRQERGIVVTGESRQYASRSFRFPEDFVAVSAPNMYAPGPIDWTSTDGAAGGNETDVTFFAGAGPILAAGFGCWFIDVDWPGDGPSSMQAFDGGGAAIADSGTVVGANGEAKFVGFVSVDPGTDLPVAAIGRVHITTGSGWAGNDWNEGATLDNLMAGTATFKVTGKVVTPSGAPLPGVTMSLSTAAFTLTARTTPLGKYTLSNVPNGKYEIRPSKAGLTFLPLVRRVTVADGNVAVPSFVGK